MDPFNNQIELALASIIVSPYSYVTNIVHTQRVTAVVSILGRSDNLPWPDVGSRAHLRLEFDDTQYSSRPLQAPTTHHIKALIGFARDWVKRESLLIHCRAGSSRSPAAAIVAAAALFPSHFRLLHEIASARSYFTPHRRFLALADSALQFSPPLSGLARTQADSKIHKSGPVVIGLPHRPTAST
jgi:predicted protein tyrosine phosphatase